MLYQDERNYGCRVSDSWIYRDLKTVILENQLLRIVILVDKGADIYQFVHKPTDVDFMWRSPWGVVDQRKLHPSTGAGESTWLDLYHGGWQTVLPGGGNPSKYRGADLGIHAEINTMPWDCQIVEDTPEKVSVRFSVRGLRMPFSCEKTLTLTSGSPVLEINEVVTNEAEETVHCVWGQHIALGAPFLSEHCVIDLPGGTLSNHEEDHHPNNRLKPGAAGKWPWTEGKDGNRIDLSKIPPKSARIYDLSYISEMPDGWYAVTNQKMEVGWGVVFPKELFRYLWFWQSIGGGFGYPWWGRTYNVGLEPFTSFSNEGLAGAVTNGTALAVEAGDRVEATIKAIAYTGNERVERINTDGSVVRRT